MTLKADLQKHGFKKVVRVGVRLHLGMALLRVAGRLLKVPHAQVMYQDAKDMIVALSSQPVNIKGIEVQRRGVPVFTSGIRAKAPSAWGGSINSRSN